MSGWKSRASPPLVGLPLHFAVTYSKANITQLSKLSHITASRAASHIYMKNILQMDHCLKHPHNELLSTSNQSFQEGQYLYLKD